MKIWINKGQYGFSTLLKNEYNGEKTTMFMDVQFSKGIEPQDTIYANITDSFLSCYKTRNEEVKPKLVVMNYEMIDTKDKTESKEGQNKTEFNLDDILGVTEIDDNFLD